MSAAPPGALGRLARWRRFQEELASSALLHGMKEVGEANKALDVVSERLSELSRRKSEDLSKGHLDLAIYSQLLAYERNALLDQEDKKLALTKTRQRVSELQDERVHAKSRSKVACARQERRQMYQRGSDEKKAFDLTADQWLATRLVRR